MKPYKKDLTFPAGTSLYLYGKMGLDWLASKNSQGWPVTSLPFMTCHTNPDGYQLDLLSLFWMVSHQIPANAPFMGLVWLDRENSQGWYQSGKLVTGHPWLFLLASQSMPMNGALAGI